MSDHTMTFCVFSFNRGRFLKNCVESIRRCVPEADIVIFDDNSTDAQTRDYLVRAESFCRVMGPEKKGDIKHGSLYHNMNSALQLCHDRSLVCFLQDDTQVVRPVSAAELRHMARLFESHPELGFLHPCFIRGIDLKKRPVIPLEGPEASLFYRKDSGQSSGTHYSDLIVFRPRRLIDAGWHFQQSEPDNNRQAREKFSMMAYMWLPFAMWLPEVPAYRGKHKTLGLKLAERRKRVGFFPFRLWTEEDVVETRDRPVAQLPVAEDCLSCVSQDPPKPWTYNPLTGLRFHKQLNNMEVAVRRWLT